MTEEWRPVVGYEGFYEVSDQGRVRSVDRYILHRNGTKPRLYKGKILVLNPDDSGHPEVVLKQHSKGKTLGVHVLVCTAFNGAKPDWAHGVRHLNGNPTDNHPTNLAWGTHAQNMQDKDAHGTNFWKNQTHCRRGHEYTPGSYYLQRNGKKRACKACNAYRAASRNRGVAA